MMILNVLFNILGYYDFQGVYQFFWLFIGFISKFCNDVYKNNDLVFLNIFLINIGYIYELLFNFVICLGVSSFMIN